MHTYIALFRGINVGGKSSVPMKTLVAVFEALEAKSVKTYIQSGNVVFQHRQADAASLSERVSAHVLERCGFRPQVLIIRGSEIEAAIRNNPFPEAVSNPSSLHVGFLASAPQAPDLEKLGSLKKNNERFQLVGNIFYLHAPDGVGRSKLASSSEKLLGVPMTDRNWNTVSNLKEMVSA